MILAPDAFMDVWLPMVIGPALRDAPVTLVGQGMRKHSFIAAADVAAFAVASIGRADAMNQHLPLGGPDAVSWWDVIGVVERVISREIQVKSVVPGHAMPGVPDAVAGLMAGLEAYDSAIPMTHLARAFEVTQTRLDDFVLGMVAGAERP